MILKSIITPRRNRLFRRKAGPSRVKLIAWQHQSGAPNFGDDLSAHIVRMMLAHHGICMDKPAKPPDGATLLAVGSILHLAPTGATIWGSGVNGKIPTRKYRFHGLDIRALRGPLSRHWLARHKGIKAPEIYGDPALLLPKLFGARFKVTPECNHIFIPNLNDLKLNIDFDLPTHASLISPMQRWDKVVAQICKARFVSASSLHGLVVAEAFGIPARYVRLSNAESRFKYEDYYEGTGRVGIAAAPTVKRAEQMGGAPLPKLDLAPLFNAFPRDLWHN